MLSLVLVILLVVGKHAHAQVYYQPEQVHLSLGYSPSEMVVTWVTMSAVNQSTVRYSMTDTLNIIQNGTETLFVDGGSQKRNIYMHRVRLTKLAPNSTYMYICGSNYGWSTRYSFTTIRAGSDWSPRFAVFGDMGNKNAKSLPYLQLEAERKHFDVILHVGDFAYNMDTNNAQVGDEFMRQVEPLAANVPYMTCAGNHELAYNFSNYKNRFTMPGGDLQGQFYSYNVGPVHIIAIQTEFYYFTKFGWKQIVSQYNWLVNDLKRANLPANRKAQPWIVVMGHRPMYCSNSNDPEHCPNVKNVIRVGIPYQKTFLYGLEDLFYQYGVDLHFWAHEHSYERMWPVYNLTVCNGSAKHPYVDPPAPVHVVTGSAGCQEGEDPFVPGGQKWSAFRTDDYGYTHMTVFNATHLYLEQVSVDKFGKVVDTLWYIRSRHGPKAFSCKPKVAGG